MSDDHPKIDLRLISSNSYQKSITKTNNNFFHASSFPISVIIKLISKSWSKAINEFCFFFLLLLFALDLDFMWTKKSVSVSMVWKQKRFIKYIKHQITGKTSFRNLSKRHHPLFFLRFIVIIWFDWYDFFSLCISLRISFWWKI